MQIANHHLVDYIEWDLLSPLTPETFASKLCNELGLTGEAIPLVSHAIHEELIKHKRDAIEWGVIGGDRETDDSKLKDKTGLGLSWGRAPKDGRGPKVLKSIWRDWADQEDLRTRFEILTPEEIERREGERERASRFVRASSSAVATKNIIFQTVEERDIQVPEFAVSQTWLMYHFVYRSNDH